MPVTNRAELERAATEAARNAWRQATGKYPLQSGLAAAVPAVLDVAKARVLVGQRLRITQAMIETAAEKANCPDVESWEAQREQREADASVILDAGLSVLVGQQELRERMDLIKRFASALADPACEGDCEGSGMDEEGAEWSLCECALSHLQRLEARVLPQQERKIAKLAWDASSDAHIGQIIAGGTTRSFDEWWDERAALASPEPDPAAGECAVCVEQDSHLPRHVHRPTPPNAGLVAFRDLWRELNGLTISAWDGFNRPEKLALLRALGESDEEAEVERGGKALWERTHKHMPWLEPAGDQSRREAFRAQSRLVVRAARDRGDA